MWLAYVDESGDTGIDGGSPAFTLGCVALPAAAWPNALSTLAQFRRRVQERYAIPVRAELKAYTLLRGSGPLAELHLPEQDRQQIYRNHLAQASAIGAQVFAVTIHKDLIRKEELRRPREAAWSYLLQRLELLTREDGTPAMLIHDEGEEALIRNLVRKAQTTGSSFGAESVSPPARLIVEDPVPRSSTQSFLLQLADLAAYAAYRRLYPPPPQRSGVCPVDMWDTLGSAVRSEVNRVANQPGSGRVPGIVEWPPR